MLYLRRNKKTACNKVGCVILKTYFYLLFNKENTSLRILICADFSCFYCANQENLIKKYSRIGLLKEQSERMTKIISQRQTFLPSHSNLWQYTVYQDSYYILSLLSPFRMWAITVLHNLPFFLLFWEIVPLWPPSPCDVCSVIHLFRLAK